MRQKWQDEDEFLQLEAELQQAEKEGDKEACRQLWERMQPLLWRKKVTGLPELAPYQSVIEALEKMTCKLGLSFPNVAHEQNPPDQFIVNVSDGTRSVQVWPLEDRGHYSIELFDYASGQEKCYQGNTTSLEEATVVLNRWFVERCTIKALHAQFPWVSVEPFKLSGPRMTLEF